MRMLEGELILFNGVVYVVKGFQHPSGYVIAYPRYDLNSVPVSKTFYRSTGAEIRYWDCIDRSVPMVPVGKAVPYTPHVDSVVGEFRRLIYEYTGIDMEDIYVTGSRALGFCCGDIDLVIYCGSKCWRVYSVLRFLRETGVTKPLTGIHVLTEHSKHPDLLLSEYTVLRSHSVLQGVYKDTRYSLRIVVFRKGFSRCVMKTRVKKHYTGLIEIVEAVSPYTTPAYYRVKLCCRSRVVYMMTFRTRYTELPVGSRLYVLDGVIEESRSGVEFLVPDHGVLKPLILNAT